MKQTNKHRKRWRIALLVGIPLLVLAVAMLTILLVASQTASDEEAPIEPRAIPSDWTVPISSTQTESVSEIDEDEIPLPTQSALPAERTISGTLAIIGNGKRFGEESYELQISSEGGVYMTSRGTFSFKVLFATIKAVLSQDVSLDRNLRPDHYTLEINGPLGIGSHRVEGTVIDNVAHVISGNEEEEIQFGVDVPFVLGTFSTYALIPLLFRELADKGSMEFQVIPLMRGRGQEEDGGKSDQPSLLRIERAGDALIRAGSSEIIVDKYILASSIGNSTLLAKDDEFLALIASGDDGSLIAYRSDYFPEGIDLP